MKYFKPLFLTKLAESQNYIDIVKPDPGQMNLIILNFKNSYLIYDIIHSVMTFN